MILAPGLLFLVFVQCVLGSYFPIDPLHLASRSNWIYNCSSCLLQTMIVDESKLHLSSCWGAPYCTSGNWSVQISCCSNYALFLFCLLLVLFLHGSPNIRLKRRTVASTSMMPLCNIRIHLGDTLCRILKTPRFW